MLVTFDDGKKGGHLVLSLLVLHDKGTPWLPGKGLTLSRPSVHRTTAEAGGRTKWEAEVHETQRETDSQDSTRHHGNYLPLSCVMSLATVEFGPTGSIKTMCLAFRTIRSGECHSLPRRTRMFFTSLVSWFTWL